MEGKIVLLIVGILMITVLTMAELTTAVPMMEVLLILIFIIMEKMEFKAGESLISTIKIVEIEASHDRDFHIYNGKVNITFTGDALPALDFETGTVVAKEGHIQLNAAFLHDWIRAVDNEDLKDLRYILKTNKADPEHIITAYGTALSGATLTIENTILDCSKEDAHRPFFMQRVLQSIKVDNTEIRRAMRLELMMMQTKRAF